MATPIGQTALSTPYPAATIVVSGYDPFLAIAFAVGSAFGSALRREDVTAFVSRHERVRNGRGAAEKSRCHGCNTWAPRTALQDTRLGFDAYCDPCVSAAARRCLEREGRLPGPGEFFCLGCEWICHRPLMTRADADGRNRWRCVLCRTEQVRAAEQRRRGRLELARGAA